MMKNLLANWKTTSAGLGAIIVAVVHLVFAVIHGNADEAVWKNDLLGVVVGIGLLAAGDAAQSSKATEAVRTQAATAIDTGDTTVLKAPSDPVVTVPTPPKV